MRPTSRNSCSALLALCSGLAAQTLVYNKSIQGNRTDTTSAVALDPQGNVYVIGTTNSTNFLRTQNNPAQPVFTNLLSSTDGGKTFTRNPIPAPVLALTSLPAAIIAGNYRSTDNGATWQPTNLTASVNQFLTDARYPTRVYAATNQGLFRSGDSGATWAFTGPTTSPITIIASSPLRPDVVFLVASTGIFRSQDGAQTWQQGNLPINPTGPAPTSITIDPTSANTIYIAGAFNNTAQQAFILKSTDGGATFKQISAQATQTIAIDPANPKSLFANGIDGTVYHSSDSGVTWTATSLTNVTLDAISFTSGNLYALADQGLYLSTDRGVTWQPTATNLPKRDLRAFLVTPTTIFLGADQGEHAYLTKWDPAGDLLWSIVIGGSYFDEGAAVAIDASGNPYITGTTSSTDFPITQGAFQPTLNGFQNVFLAKFNPDGDQLLYATYLGGSASDAVSAIAVDASGSAYLTGYAVSPDFPTTPHAYQPRHIGSCGQAGGDAYVAKFSPTASSLIYSTLIGGSCAQTATAIAVDPVGHAYITGATASPDFPVTKSALQPTFGGSTDGFLSELTPAGDALLISTFLGGPSSDIAAGLAVDAAGYIYIAGNGIGFPTPSPQLQCDGSLISYGGLPLTIQAPPYFLKLAPGATALASLQTFSDCGTVVQSLALDASGNTWLGGIADPSNYDTVAPLQTLAAGSYFLREYAPDAQTILFSTLLDGFQSFTIGGGAYVASSPASLEKIDTSIPYPAQIDSIQKYGTLSIPALVGYSGPIGIAPNELIVINGHGFTSSTRVLFDGVSATLVSVQNTKIICIVPSEVDGNRSQIQATNSNSNTVTVSAVPSAVEILALANQDGTVNSATNPAPAGSIMTLYASGLGTSIGQTQVVFDDAAPISYLGPVPFARTGIVQINYTVPDIPGQSIISVVNGNSTDYAYVYLK